jgi:antibiotic biosynthesis monooxygenase (ABM) superfamily enzyme
MEQEDKRITAVVTRNVLPGRERDYEEWGRRVVAASARYGANGHTFLTPGFWSPSSGPTRW